MRSSTGRHCEAARHQGREPAVSAALACDARSLADRLVGRAFPAMVLASFRSSWSSVDLGRLASESALVLYLYPGGDGACGGEDTSRMDGVQHRAFRAHQRELRALRFQAIGISSQSTRSQNRSAFADRVDHKLLSDPELLLARELGLPTFTVNGARWYERLTLVVAEGSIRKVFFPVGSPARNPDQAIAWIRLQGSGASGGDAG